MKWIWLPLEGANPPMAQSKYSVILEAVKMMEAALNEGGYLLLHCSAGIHRTGKRKDLLFTSRNDCQYVA
jgi:protein-tyrosine phosphatase